MKYQHFSVEEREAIQEGLWRKESARRIAARLGRSHASVVREINRNLPPLHRRYTPRLAHARALAKRKCRGRTERLKNARIRAYVEERLKERWSPEQIAGRMWIDLGERCSHEAIYQFIYARVTSYGAVRGEDLRPFLRRARKRRMRKGCRRGERVLKPCGISIDMRPLIVAERARLGDWESDTVESCAHKPGVNTLLERRTGLVLITKLAGKKSADTVAALAARAASLPCEARRTLTLDHGPENAAWESIEAATGMRCFFAHPYHAWERGANENANGLLRDYFPKKTDFTLVPDAAIAAVEYALNTRPRKRLQWKSPLEVWGGALQG